MDMVIWAVIGVVVVVIALFVMYLNSFITLKNRIENAWAQIDVQLKRRFDLIPNLTETVKGYAKYERGTYEMVAKARTAYLNAGTVKDKAAADNMLSGALKSLFAVAEAYPALRASENFKSLQEELAATENKLAYARQFYNDNVMALNTNIETFPASIVASIMGFKSRDYYQTDEGEKKDMAKAPKVKFD